MKVTQKGQIKPASIVTDTTFVGRAPPVDAAVTHAARAAGLRIDFVIAGASKSGSSYLHETLMANPAISIPSREVFELHTKHYSPTGLRKIAGELDASKITGIKRPNYIYDLSAMNRLRAISSHTRVIIQVRDPVLRSISHFYHLRRYAQVAFVSIEEMVNALVDGDLPRLGPVAYEIDAESRYANAVAHARHLFGSENVLLLNFEDMASDPQSAIDRVCAFINAPTAPAPQLPAIPQKVVYAEEWQQLWAASCRLEGICNESGIVVAYRNRPLAPGRQRRVDSLRREAHARYDDRKPVLPPEQIERMRHYFAGEYEFLATEGLMMHELSRMELTLV